MFIFLMIISTILILIDKIFIISFSLTIIYCKNISFNIIAAFIAIRKVKVINTYDTMSIIYTVIIIILVSIWQI